MACPGGRARVRRLAARHKYAPGGAVKCARRMKPAQARPAADVICWGPRHAFLFSDRQISTGLIASRQAAQGVIDISLP